MVAGTPSIEIKLENQEGRKKTKANDRYFNNQKLPIYQKADDISGVVEVKYNKKLEHQGIRIELIGHIGILIFKRKLC